MKKQLLFIATLIVSLFISQIGYSTNYTVNTVGASAFSPSNLPVFIGDSVTFVNTGGFHNVNGSILTFPLNPQGFENPEGVDAGWTYVHIFTIPGTYNYQCDPHIPAMVGVINVTAPITPLIASVQTNNPLCFGDTTGSVSVNINQTNPLTNVEVKLFWQNPTLGFWVNLGAANGTGNSFFFSNLWAGDYRVDLNDSLNGNFIENSFFTIVDADELVISTFLLMVSNPITPVSNDGSIGITVSGGTPFMPGSSYSFSWTGPNGFVATTEDIANLGVGSYTVTVTDENGCTDSKTYNLTAYVPCMFRHDSTQSVSCYLEQDGKIYIDSLAGTGDYTISIDTLDPAIYPPSPLSAASEVVLPNGTPSYLFDGSSAAYSIGKNDYWILFADASTCSFYNLIPISVDRDGSPFIIDTAIILVTDTLNPNGGFTVNVSQGGYSNGAIPPYNYVWYDSLGNIISGANTNMLSQIDTGAYSVVITDNGYGCSDSIILQMSLAPPDYLDSILTHNACPGGNTGEVLLIAGSAWSSFKLYDNSNNVVDSSNQYTVSNLSSGNYYFVLSSNTLADDTMFFEILEPIVDSIYILSALNGNTLCSGDSSRILVNMSNIDTSLYNYAYLVQGYNPGYSIADTSVRYFYVGNYDLIIHYTTKNSGTFTSCGVVESFSITEYDLSIAAVSSADEVCGVSDATLIIELDSINISNLPVSFFINGDSILASPNFSDTFIINPNTIYDSIYVRDNLGCEVKWNSAVVVNQIIPITLDTNIVKESCRGNDGEIHLVVSSGQGEYSYVLSKEVPFNVPLIIDSASNIKDSIFIPSLVSGTYFIEVTDDSMCVYLDTFLVEKVVPFSLLSLTKTKETCCGFDGSISANIQLGDGSDLTYTLAFDTMTIAVEVGNNVYPYMNGGNVWPSQSYIDAFVIVQDTPDFDSLTRGYYSIYIEDEFGCADSADYSSLLLSTSTINTQVYIDSSYQIDMDYSYTNVVCFGDTNATVKVLYPDECYSYELWLYHDTVSAELIVVDEITLQDTSVYYNELYAGLYGIQGISTSNYAGCMRRSATFEIIEPEIISYNSPLSTAAFCLNNGFLIDGGACNGIVYLPSSPIGGVYDTSVVLADTVYQYYINRVNSSVSYFQGPILTDNAFIGLCPGDYEVQVLDGNNCIIKDTVTVADSSLYIDSLTMTTISCYDSSDATISVFSHGGVGFYSYVWTDATSLILSDTTQTIDSLLEGSYSVKVVDEAGCYAESSITIPSAPFELELYSRIVGFESEETCYGYSYDGSVGYEIRGGSGPYVFNWVNTDTTRTGSYVSYALYCDTCISDDGITAVDSVYMLDSLTADIYRVVLTDANGCTAVNWFPLDSVRIDAENINNILSIDSIVGNGTLCYGSSDGEITFYMNDSVMWPLTFILDSNVTISNDSLVSNTGIFTSLSANEYSILITDSFGCFIEDKYIISEYDEIIIDNIVTDLKCYESGDGMIQVTVTGGLAPFVSSSNWNPTSFSLVGTTVLDNLTVGTYGVSITDAANCMAFDSISVDQPSPLQITVSLEDALCKGSADASGSVSVIGGTPAYSYSWSGSGSTLSNIENVTAGTYTCTVTDNNSCIETIELTLEEPTAVVLNVIDVVDNLCFGDAEGSIMVSASGGTPGYVQYFIKTSAGVSFPQSSNEFIDLLSDTYSLWVEDTNGCLSEKVIDEKLGEPGKIILTPTVVALSCFESNDGGVNLVFENGVSPYTYKLTYAGSSIASGIVFQDSDTLKTIYLAEGEYYFEMSDYNNCKDSIYVTVYQPDEVIASFTASDDFILKGEKVSVANFSTGANVFIWNFGDNTNSLEIFETDHKYNQQGTFEIMLVANNSNLNDICNDTSRMSIDVEGYDIYNVFSPNNDGVNDVYQFSDEMLVSLKVIIYNRWGQQVYAFDDVNGVWDGNGYNGESLPEGAYFFTMEAEGLLGEAYIEEGSITLIR